MRRPIGFLTSNLNGIFPEIRVHGVVTRTCSQNRHRIMSIRAGWDIGPSLQFLFWQMDPEFQLGNLSDARDHWGRWNPRLFPSTMLVSAICPEGWSGHVWGPAISRDSYEHPCCTKLWPPGIISCWKELMLLREIVNYRSRARNEQGEATTSCHNYKAGRWSSVLSKEPTWKVSPGQGLDNWASVKIIRVHS